MLTVHNYSSVQTKVMGNMDKYLPIMISFKSLIQNSIISMLSSGEVQDIKDSNLNLDVIDKLIRLGQIVYKNQSHTHNDETLYCLCMAIGTIIKECDWGTKYIQQDGMCEIAKKIVG